MDGGISCVVRVWLMWYFFGGNGKLMFERDVVGS
jgi:hypothetical protein